MEAIHPIGIVAQRTGLSPHVLRVWERRYGALQPGRTRTNRRLYTEDDVRRLMLLRDATRGRRTIGQVASLSSDRLAALIDADRAHTGPPGNLLTGSAEALVAEGMDAVGRLDTQGFRQVLAHAAVSLGLLTLLDRVAGPLLQQVGEAWQEGRLRPAHEHLATAAIRTLLGDVLERYAGSGTAPVLVATTPSGQAHEMGALLAAASGAAVGWRAIYLGASLPAEEIAAAVEHAGARAVLLSLVYPRGDAAAVHELLRLRQLLPREVSILVGGRAAESYVALLPNNGIEHPADLAVLRARLLDLAEPTGPA